VVGKLRHRLDMSIEEGQMDNSAPSRPTIDGNLPPINTQRWSPHRKALVVNAVRSGAISFEEARNRYQLSAEELLAWQQAMETHGIGGCSSAGYRHIRGPDIH